VDKGRGQIGDVVQIAPGQMKVFIILDGAGQISFAGESVDFKKGETILSPAALNATMAFNELTEYLLVTV
jgi:mannose-6-phosphate isomerase-like protein (cupin superfamily)